MHIYAHLSAGLLCAFVTLSNAAQPLPNDPDYDPYACGPITRPGQYGPFDFRRATSEQVSLVNAHYIPGMDGMRTGKYINERGHIWNEFDYTLRALPNHHGALQAIDQLARTLGSDKPPRAARSAHCYFRRAIHFTPDDGMVRLLYGLYLLRRNKAQEAISQLDNAVELGPRTSSLYYNLGLAYFELKDYGKALEFAHVAYDMGFPLPGLKNMLTRAGQWREKASDAQEAPRPESPSSQEVPVSNEKAE